MKKIVFLLAALLLTVSSFAQNAKAIYDKYSDMKGVEAVYISPAMFKMVGKLPDAEVGDKDMDFSKMVRNYRGLYVLEFSNRVKGQEMLSEVDKMIKKGKYETLMEAKENGEVTRMYVEAKGSVCTSLVIISMEGSEIDFICIDGDINMSEIRKMTN